MTLRKMDVPIDIRTTAVAGPPPVTAGFSILDAVPLGDVRDT